MFGFKSAQQKRIDDDAVTIADLRTKLKAALADLGKTVIERDNLRDSRDIALRQNAHLRTDVEQLERDIAGLLPDAEKYRRSRANLKQFRAQPAHH